MPVCQADSTSHSSRSSHVPARGGHTTGGGMCATRGLLLQQLLLLTTAVAIISAQKNRVRKECELGSISECTKPIIQAQEKIGLDETQALTKINGLIATDPRNPYDTNYDGICGLLKGIDLDKVEECMTSATDECTIEPTRPDEDTDVYSKKHRKPSLTDFLRLPATGKMLCVKGCEYLNQRMYATYNCSVKHMQLLQEILKNPELELTAGSKKCKSFTDYVRCVSSPAGGCTGLTAQLQQMAHNFDKPMTDCGAKKIVIGLTKKGHDKPPRKGGENALPEPENGSRGLGSVLTSVLTTVILTLLLHH